MAETSLPDDLLPSLLGTLCAQDLLTVRRVCQRWRSASEERLQHVWRNFFIEECPYSGAWAACERGSADYLRCFLRMKRLKSQLRRGWTREFAKSFQMGSTAAGFAIGLSRTSSLT